FQGTMQLIASRIRKASPGEVDESDFLTLSTPQIDHMATRVAEILRKLRNPHLRNLVECFLIDEEFMRRFTNAPAGVKNHHAYQGGLLEHVLSLMELVLVVSPRYPEVDAEILLAGAFLHDLGKIEELAYDRELSYT